MSALIVFSLLQSIMQLFGTSVDPSREDPPTLPGVRTTPLQQVRINAGSAFARAQVLRLADTAEIGGM